MRSDGARFSKQSAERIWFWKWIATVYFREKQVFQGPLDRILLQHGAAVARAGSQFDTDLVPSI